MKLSLYYTFLIMPFCAYAASQRDIDVAAKNFVMSDKTSACLTEYYPKGDLTNEEKTVFIFSSLEKILDNPEPFSTIYGWKISKLYSYIDNLPTDDIPLKYVPILFRALRVGAPMLTADVIIIDALDRIVGDNPGYKLSYIERVHPARDVRVALIDKWEEIFENNKVEIMKKREYKRKYYGKKIPLD